MITICKGWRDGGIENFFGIGMEKSHAGKGRLHVIGNRMKKTLGIRSVNGSVHNDHLAIQVVEGADAEIPPFF